MLTYSRWAPADAVPETIDHVRAHLSSVATPDDDPTRYADEVDVTLAKDGDGILISGQLDREPVADYLRPDFDPEAEAAANPLSVPSIEDES
jgi:hypothetical protein